VGIEVRPTQPPHLLRIVDVPSGYPEDLETFGMPDTVDITDILSVDMTPQESGAHSTSCPDMSVAASKSVDLGTSMSADFDDRMREIQNTATLEFVHDTVGACSIRSEVLHDNCCRCGLSLKVLSHLIRCRAARYVYSHVRCESGDAAWAPYCVLCPARHTVKEPLLYIVLTLHR